MHPESHSPFDEYRKGFFLIRQIAQRIAAGQLLGDPHKVQVFDNQPVLNSAVDMKYLREFTFLKRLYLDRMLKPLTSPDDDRQLQFRPEQTVDSSTK